MREKRDIIYHLIIIKFTNGCNLYPFVQQPVSVCLSL